MCAKTLSVYKSQKLKEQTVVLNRRMTASASLNKPWYTAHLWSEVDIFLTNLSIAYKEALQKFLSSTKRGWIVFMLSFGCIILFLQITPKEIAPKEDRNIIGVYVPAISSNDISSSVEKEIKSIPEAESNMYSSVIGEQILYYHSSLTT